MRTRTQQVVPWNTSNQCKVGIDWLWSSETHVFNSSLLPLHFEAILIFLHHHLMSNENDPGWLGYFSGVDIRCPSYVGSFFHKPWNKDSVMKQRSISMESKAPSKNSKIDRIPTGTPNSVSCDLVKLFWDTPGFFRGSVQERSGPLGDFWEGPLL